MAAFPEGTWGRRIAEVLANRLHSPHRAKTTRDLVRFDKLTSISRSVSEDRSLKPLRDRRVGSAKYRSTA